jgi:hypothetical protein
VQELRKQTDDEELQAGISKSVDIIQSVLEQMIPSTKNTLRSQS